VTPTDSYASGFLSLNNGETVENRGLGFPFADSSPKITIKSSKPRFVSVFAGDFATSAQERRDVLGVNVGARMFKGVSWVGGNSKGGAASIGSNVGGSLATELIESMTHRATKLLPRGRLDLMADYDLLGRGLGCKENGRPRTDLTLAGSQNGLDGPRWIHIPKVLDAGLG
jgi:hypothetical protein